MDFYEVIARRRTTRCFKPLGEVARFATAFAPYDGEELTERLAELSNLD